MLEIRRARAAHLTFGVVALLSVTTLAAAPGRVTISLDGTWQVADSLDADQIPAAFDHRGPVPGMANLATPAFPDVDRFDSTEYLTNQVRHKLLPESTPTGAPVGISRQNRNFFWYRRIFQVEARKQVAILKINKAQFGTAVWLNGKKVGEHTGCFTAGYFDLTAAIHWQGENTLMVRIGAHPAALPPTIATGTDQEKSKWTPGIYDDVSLMLSDNPVIQQIQVAPRLDTSEIVVQTVLKNHTAKAVSFALRQRVKAAKSQAEAGSGAQQKLTLGPDEEKVLTQNIRIPNPTLWTPESPFLYVLETSTGGDNTTTRFGMRELRFDTATRRAWLNGKVYFMRGSNITLHRFFEDPKAGSLVWNEAWVRKLLIDIPKRMHWNSFRFCIGPVPDKWLDIADEAGLLIQNEYFIWKWHDQWDTAQLTRDYREWMRDNWNHPSVAIWDASNETIAPILADQIIPAVRGDDLSHRAWENSYNLPSGPDDPIEDHPYLFSKNQQPPTAEKPLFHMTDLEKTSSQPRHADSDHSGHALILNEYGWLWLNRDGSPTTITQGVWDNILPNSTAAQRFDLNGYLLGGLTEYWRAHRNYAAVMHFVYLTSSYPGAYTSDHFRNLEELELEPSFADYVGQAFQPLGVYVDFWQPQLKAGASHRFTVMMINDDYQAKSGKLILTLENARAEAVFHLPALGQQSYQIDLKIPEPKGDYVLKAEACAEGETSGTVSRRRVKIQ